MTVHEILEILRQQVKDLKEDMAYARSGIAISILNTAIDEKQNHISIIEKRIADDKSTNTSR